MKGVEKAEKGGLVRPGIDGIKEAQEKGQRISIEW